MMVLAVANAARSRIIGPEDLCRLPTKSHKAGTLMTEAAVGAHAPRQR